jgi:hypothetical protein
MCNWNAVNGIVRKAIRSNRYADSEIGDALRRLAEEGRGVTVETLRISLDGFPTPSPRPSTTDARVGEGLRLAAKYAAMEAAGEMPALEEAE